MNPEIHLQIAGVLMLLLVVVNLYVPRRFNWREEMTSLSLLNRQIFQVHAGFICVMLMGMGLLALLLSGELLEPTRLARAVLAGIGSFWLLRLMAQWFVYDRRLWRGHRFNTAVHFIVTGVWVYFAATFFYALWWNLGA